MKGLWIPAILLSGYCLGNSQSAASLGDTAQNDTTCCQAVELQRAAPIGDFSLPYGFRGYSFGTPHMRMNGLKMRSMHGRDIWYEVQGGIDIGPARMKSLGFGFRDDRFYGVIADPADYRGFVDLKAIIDSVYGPPMKTDSLASSITYFWNVPNLVFKLRLYWADRRMDDKRNDMILSIIAVPILTDKGNGIIVNAPDSGR